MTQSTRILLIRHGETAWNAERRLQGHIDIALNDEGERQAAVT
jgi:2,3-bisphosphoglycerate-dependent phosphoglycerate mutase